MMQTRRIDIDEQELDLGLRYSVSDREARCLYSLAEASQPGAIVEIGSWKGRSTVYLAKGAERGGKGNKVYAVDPHLSGTEGVFRENITKLGVDNIVISLIMKSEEAIKQWHHPVSLLFIDGAHDYESVKKDFVLWEPWLITGGVIALHDRFFQGPSKVIRNYVLKSNSFSSVRVVDSMLFATKGIESTFPDKLTRLERLLLSHIVFLVATLMRPKPPLRLRIILNKVVKRIF